MKRSPKAGTALTCIATGALALVAALLLPTAATAVEAPAEPGSGFSSYNLAANAPAVQVRFADNDNCSARAGGTGGCEGVIPETVSTLRNGPIGYALSSVVWPGTLAGNLGSLILAANPNAPSQASMLNSPIRAESRTGAGPDTVTNSSYPGTTMVATAKDDVVSAKADVASSSSTPVGNFGNTTSNTLVKLMGPAQAIGTAFSRADDVNLAGGQITIGSVTSTVEATTDGKKASAKGRTLVNDVRIAGVPVTIDDRGITVQGQNNPANATAASAVNTVVSNLGMRVALSQPEGKPEGGKITYSAGSLIINFAPPGAEGRSFTVIFGGATVSLVAAPEGAGLDFSFDTGTTTPFEPAGGTTTTGGTTGGGTVLAPVSEGGTAGSQPLSDGAAPTAPEVAGGGDSSLQTALAGGRVPLPGPASPAYLIVGLFGAGLMLAGMRQLPDRLLEARASTCVLGETR